VPINPTQIKVIRKLLRSGATARVSRLLQRIHPADVADLFSEVNDTETKQLVDILFAAKLAGGTLRELPEGILENVLEMISDDRVAQMIDNEAPDDALLFLSLLPEERVEAIRKLLEPQQAAEITRLLLYPEGSAGSVMTTNVLALEQHCTAEDAINELRKQGEDLEAIFYLYVVDENNRLSGVIPLRKLILSAPGTRLHDLMVRDPISANARDDQESVAGIVAKYNFLSLPVTDDDGKLIGVVTVDDVIDVIHEEATEDFYHMAGLDEEDRVFSPVGQSVRKRLGWTLFHLLMVSAAALIISLYFESIQKLVALAVFLPVVAGLGGNSGTQALTVVIRGIALGELEFSSALRAIGKQLAVGLLVGVVAGLVASVLALAWRADTGLGLWIGPVLFVSLLGNMAVGAFVGAALPLLLKAVGRDPALGSGIVVGAITDAFGYFSFLALATLAMRLLGV